MKKTFFIGSFLLVLLFIFPGCEKSAADEAKIISWEEMSKALPQEVEGFERQKDKGEYDPSGSNLWSFVQRPFSKGQDKISISFLDTNYERILSGEFYSTAEIKNDQDINRKIKIGPYNGWEKVNIDQKKGKRTNVIVLVKDRILVRVAATAEVSEEIIQKATTEVNYKILEELIDSAEE